MSLTSSSSSLRMLKFWRRWWLWWPMDIRRQIIWVPSWGFSWLLRNGLMDAARWWSPRVHFRHKVQPGATYEDLILLSRILLMSQNVAETNVVPISFLFKHLQRTALDCRWYVFCCLRFGKNSSF
jgi:hypothetical protein